MGCCVGGVRPGHRGQVRFHPTISFEIGTNTRKGAVPPDAQLNSTTLATGRDNKKDQSFHNVTFAYRANTIGQDSIHHRLGDSSSEIQKSVTFGGGNTSLAHRRGRFPVFDESQHAQSLHDLEDGSVGSQKKVDATRKVLEESSYKQPNKNFVQMEGSKKVNEKSDKEFVLKPVYVTSALTRPPPKDVGIQERPTQDHNSSKDRLSIDGDEEPKVQQIRAKRLSRDFGAESRQKDLSLQKLMDIDERDDESGASSPKKMASPSRKGAVLPEPSIEGEFISEELKKIDRLDLGEHSEMNLDEGPSATHQSLDEI